MWRVINAAVTLVALIAFVSAERNEQDMENNDQLITKDLSMQGFYYDQTLDAVPEKVYAGPLRSAEEDEVIVVSRDNVQQLIKTLMLAYTHSKDPTMTQLFKSGSLGALKTTFKYLGKEELGDNILSTARKFIAELNLEDEEEKVLGEFAEEYLEKHKFKIVVPESFLLHEKEMLEFLDMKKKMSKKKGRSMNFE